MKKQARRFETEYLETGRLSEPLQHVYRRSAELASALSSVADEDTLNAFGVGVLGIVMEELSGGVYIPEPKTLARLARDHRIRRDYDGANHHELALREKVTIRHVRRIVAIEKK